MSKTAKLVSVALASAAQPYKPLTVTGLTPLRGDRLADLADHLANQYLLEFVANPAEDGAALQPVTVKSKIADLDVMVPDKVWVPSAQGEERP